MVQRLGKGSFYQVCMHLAGSLHLSTVRKRSIHGGFFQHAKHMEQLSCLPLDDG